jgi:hypothetical protein
MDTLIGVMDGYTQGYMDRCMIYMSAYVCIGHVDTHSGTVHGHDTH